MKAIILARVSTEEQMNEGQSIPAQLSRAREYAKRKELKIESEHQFDESSTKDKRVKFEKVINEVKKSKESIALIVETVDRLQRSFKESVILDDFRKDGKIELHFIRENLVIHKDSNSSEIQRWDLAVFVAKSYVLQISDNVKRTIEKKIKNGEVIGKAPIGYLNVINERGNKDVAIDNARAPLIIKIFELYAAANYSMKTIATMITDLGLTSNTPARNKLKMRQIEYILKNPFYYGDQLHKGQIYPHKYEPLVSHELFKKCFQVREDWGRKPTKHASKPFIFKGLATCSNCGCTITPSLKKGKFIYYNCTNYKGICKKIYVKEEMLLEPIRSVLKVIKLSQKRIDEIVEALKITEQSKNKFQQQQFKELRNEHDRISNRISVMYVDRLDGRITTDEYDKNVKEFKEKQDDLLFQMRKYNNADKTFYITANHILSLAQRASEIFESSQVEEKRQLLNFLFRNLQLDGKKLQYKLKTPFDTVLLVQNNPNWGG